MKRQKPGQAQESTEAWGNRVSTRMCRRLESAHHPVVPKGRARAEAAADPLAPEAGAAQAPGHPGHHSGERPWSVTEAIRHQARAGDTPPTTNTLPHPHLRQRSESGFAGSAAWAAWPGRSSFMTQPPEP